MIPLHSEILQCVVQLLSRVQPCDFINCRMPGFSGSHCLPEFAKLMSIELVMPSNHLILCCPLLLLPSVFPSIRVFSSESALHIRWPNYWSFSFSISPSNEYSGLISFRIDWFDPLLSKGLSRVFSNTTVQKHQFFSTQPLYGSTLTSTHDYWKNIAFTTRIFVGKVMSLLCNMLSRFVIAFLSRSKRL